MFPSLNNNTSLAILPDDPIAIIATIPVGETGYETPKPLIGLRKDIHIPPEWYWFLRLDYGEIAFEGIKFVKDGHGKWYLMYGKEHIGRLFYSGQSMKFVGNKFNTNLPRFGMTIDQLVKIAWELFKMSNFTKPYIRPVLIGMAAEKGVSIKSRRGLFLSMEALTLGDYHKLKPAEGTTITGAELLLDLTSPYQRPTARNSTFCAKSPSNATYIIGRQAKEKAESLGFNDALILSDEYLADTSSSNIFGIKENTLFSTHSDGRWLPGLTGQHVQSCAANDGMLIADSSPIHWTMVRQFKAMFITGCAVDMKFVHKIHIMRDDKIIEVITFEEPAMEIYSPLKASYDDSIMNKVKYPVTFFK